MLRSRKKSFFALPLLLLFLFLAFCLPLVLVDVALVLVAALVTIDAVAVMFLTSGVHVKSLSTLKKRPVS